MLILLFVLLLIVGVIYGSEMDRINRRTVSSFELERYLGHWYEIARFDHAFERGLVEVEATYELRPDGKIAVTNSGVDLETDRRKIARGKAYAASSPGKLRVSFFWIFYSDYNVLELGESYEWALVGSSSPKYLWILSRTPRLPIATMNHILRLVQQRGYPSERLIYIDQKSDTGL